MPPMTIHLEHDPATGTITAIFTIEGTDQSSVSVVGSFNDWTPGQHTFGPAEEGLLSATVPVQPGEELHFRYLAADGHWFDDPEADSITEYGSVITVPPASVQPTVPAMTQSAGKDATPASPAPADPQAPEEKLPKVRKSTRA
jgi:1,4-alpha-glucan branching enzyme